MLVKVNNVVSLSLDSVVPVSFGLHPFVLQNLVALVRSVLLAALDLHAVLFQKVKACSVLF